MNAIQTFLKQIGTRRMYLMGGVAIALLGALTFLAFRGSSAEMGYLYTDLDPSAAQSISQKLSAQNVKFQISGDGTAIMAPTDQLAQLRMSMAGEQVGGKIGYDVLDSASPFGLSSSREKMDETRAIEGELARSIGTLESVSSARVHIVMPERAVFAEEGRKATAGVTVRTRGRLSPENVQAIRYLVSSSVPELSPASVSIVDQTCRLLARAGDAGATTDAETDAMQQATEERLRTQIESLIEPIVGAGKVRAEVSAAIDRDSRREESQTFDPDKQVIAHQTSVNTGDQSQENNPSAQGASVSTQLPGGTPPAAAGSGDTRQANSKQTSEDTTYDNTRTNAVVVRQPGALKRLTVAVMIDSGAKPLPAAQIQRLTTLVQNAVGYDAQRGDSVAIENMAFAQPEEVAPLGGFLDSLPKDQLFNVLKLLVIGGIGLFALTMMRTRGAADLTASEFP
ncbi:flagellar basal-body MS-ring/collar protein FliF [soil metagenome]